MQHRIKLILTKHRGLLVQCFVYGFLLLKSFAVIKVLNYLGKDYLLLISQSIVVTGLFTQLGFLNYEAAYIKDVAIGKKNSAFASMVFLLCTTIFLIGVFATVFEKEVLQLIWGGKGSKAYLYLLLLYICAAMLNQLGFYVRQANGEFGEYSKIIVYQQVAQLFVVILSFFLNCSTLMLLIMLLVSEAAVFFVFNNALILDCYRNSQKNEIAGWVKTNLSMSSGLLLAGGFIWTIQNYGRFIFVEQSAETMAIYIVSFTVASLPNVLIQPISNVFYLELCRSKKPDYALKKWILIAFIFIGSFTALEVVVSELIVSLVSDRRLYIGHQYYLWMGLGQLVFCITRVLSLYFAATKNQIYCACGYGIGALIIVSLYRLDEAITILDSAKYFVVSLLAVQLALYLSYKSIKKSEIVAV